MNLLENIKEGLRSIQSNILRTVLTALIIAIGITSLVGILTAIDGIQSSVDNSFAGLGANSFDIRNRDVFRIRRDGEKEKKLPPIDYRQAKMYKARFGHSAVITLKTNVTFNAQIKNGSKKTNPNSRVMGIDENFMDMKGYKVATGRTFSNNDLRLATNVCILGVDVISQLFEKESPLNQEINILGQKFKVIGLLEKKGSLMGGGDDRVVFVPLETGRKISEGRSLTFDITTSVPNITDLEAVMGEARGIMRVVREDKLGENDSFTIERSDSIAKSFGTITDSLRLGGFVIGFITLLGASIALMNIMMVSVTERTREIGIRKSLGATPLRIRQQFLIEAIVICILGGIGGIILAIPIGNVIAQGISQGTASFIIPWLWMMIGILVCVAVGLFSGIYPAYKASKLDPIESLRYE
ncbi:putative ABC transport system permease protein [Pseudarcicella hirudinis]|uniref:Putative ABC transport system permease protein n=1 Tax=Pseudarcicella hirudinis TaxID=1079859 RepID=A0A1I5Y4U2_9BACT|nr:ABC transporter permease [Pseudarcicella hirudinis]SFQ39218.1 putative ABC transport system permease protein [Pseudarcicella hirudinis]